MEHTPIPWAFEAVQHDELRITAPNEGPEELAIVYATHDAAFIVRAVNNHDALLSALEGLFIIATEDGKREVTIREAEAIIEARAVILAAKGD